MIGKSKGFTLIELLVVVAIIGILSTVVLGMLSSARSKGNDAKVKATLAAIRSRAEIYSVNNGNTYGITVNGNCSTASSIFTDSTSGMSTTLSGLPSGVTAICYSSSIAYAVSASLPYAGGHWCVDSTGATRRIGVAVGTTVCPAS